MIGVVSVTGAMSKYGVCPSCGSRHIRVSEARTTKEKLLEWIGVYQLRCRECRLRYQGSVWQPRNVFYARCPKCYRMELSTWSEQYYNPPTRTILALRLGATPYRCEFCRCNFASWRACKERFLWRNHRKPASSSPDSDRGTAAIGSDHFSPSKRR